VHADDGCAPPRCPACLQHRRCGCPRDADRTTARLPRARRHAPPPLREVEDAAVRVDGGDPVRRNDLRPPARALDDEAPRLTRLRVDHDSRHAPLTQPEAFAVRQPVLEDIAPPPEDAFTGTMHAVSFAR
jgi:hypothetical protein